MIMRTLISALLVAILGAPAGGPALAQTPPVFTLTLSGNKFDKSELKVPANTRFVIVVKNEDTTVEEFESNELKVEKIVPAKGEIRVNVGPLKPGRYKYVGEFHEATANGFVVAE
jgi:hypothetical protein